MLPSSLQIEEVALIVCGSRPTQIERALVMVHLPPSIVQGDGKAPTCNLCMDAEESTLDDCCVEAVDWTKLQVSPKSRNYPYPPRSTKNPLPSLKLVLN